MTMATPTTPDTTESTATATSTSTSSSVATTPTGTGTGTGIGTPLSTSPHAFQVGTQSDLEFNGFDDPAGLSVKSSTSSPSLYSGLGSTAFFTIPSPSATFSSTPSSTSAFSSTSSLSLSLSTSSTLSETAPSTSTSPSSSLTSSLSQSAPISLSLTDDELAFGLFDVVDVDLDVIDGADSLVEQREGERVLNVSKPMTISKPNPARMSMAGSTPIQGFLASTPRATAVAAAGEDTREDEMREDGEKEVVNIIEGKDERMGRDEDGDETYLDMECGVFERRDEADALEPSQTDALDVALAPPTNVLPTETGEPQIQTTETEPQTETETQNGPSTSPRRNTRLERWLEQQSDLWVAPPPPPVVPVFSSSPLSSNLGNENATRENEKKERDRIESIRISGVVNSAAMFAVKRKESLRAQRAREREEKEREDKEREREDVVTPTPFAATSNDGAAAESTQSTPPDIVGDVTVSPTNSSLDSHLLSSLPSNENDNENEGETESPLLTSPMASPVSPLAPASAFVMKTEAPGLSMTTMSRFKQIAPTLIIPPSVNGGSQGQGQGHRTTDSIPNLLGGLAPLSSSSSISQPFSKPIPSPLLVPSTPLSPTFSASFSFGGVPSGISSRRNSHQNVPGSGSGDAHISTSNSNAHIFSNTDAHIFTNIDSDTNTNLNTTYPSGEDTRDTLTDVNGAYLLVPTQEAEAARADSPLLGCWAPSGAPIQAPVEADLDKPLPLPPAPSPSPPASMTELPNAAPHLPPILTSHQHQPHQLLTVSSPAAQYQYPQPQPQPQLQSHNAFTNPSRPKTAPHSRLSPAVSPFTSPNVSPLPPSFVPAALTNANGGFGRHSPHNSGNFTQLPIGVNPGSSFTTSGFGLNGQTHSRSGSGTSSPARRYSHQTQPTQGTAMYAQFSQYSFGASAAVNSGASASTNVSNSPPMSAAPSRKPSLLRGVKEEGGVVEMVAERLNDLTRPPMQGLRSRSYSTTLSGASNGLGSGLRPSTSSGLLGSGFGGQHHGQYQPAPTPTTSPTAQFHLPTAMLHKSQSLAQLSLFANAQPLGVSTQQPQQQQQTPLPPSSPPTRRLSRIPPTAPNLNSLSMNHSPPNGASQTHSYSSSVASFTSLPEDASFVSTATAQQQPRPTHSADPSTSLSPTRNAVYIDSDAMKEKLDELLEMAKVEIEAAEAESMVDESNDGDDDTVEGMVENWMYSYSNSHSRSNSVPLSRTGSVSASASASGYGTPFSALRKNSATSNGSDKPTPANTTASVIPSTPSPAIRPQAQQYVSPASSNGPPPNTPMTAYFSLSSGSPASSAAAPTPSAGGFYMSPEASSSQVYIGSGSSGTHSRAGSKESNKEKERAMQGVRASVGMTTTTIASEPKIDQPNVDPASTMVANSGDVFTATLMSTAQDKTSSSTPVRPPPAPPLDIGEVVESLEAVERARRSVGNGSAESYGDPYGGFEEAEEDADSYEGEEDLSTSDEEMMDEAIALARDLGVGDRLEFGGRRSLEGMFEDGGDGWEEFEDEEMGVGMVDVDVSNLEDRYATAKRRSVLLAGFTGMTTQNGSLKRKNSVRRASVVGGVKGNGSVGFVVGGSMRRRGSSAAGRGRPTPAVAIHLEEGGERALSGVGEDEEFGLGNGLAPPSRWSLTSSVQADDQRGSVDGKPTKKKRRSFVPFVGTGDKEKEKEREREREKEKEKEETTVTTSPKENTGKKRNRLASFISRLSGVGVGGTVGAPTLMAAAMAASSTPATPYMDFQSSPAMPVNFAERNGSGLLPSPIILNSREHSPPPPVPQVPLSPKLSQHRASPRALGIDVQAANYVPPMSLAKGNSKSVPSSPISPRTRLPPGLIIPPLPTRPVPSPPEIASAPAANTLEQPQSAGLWDMPSPVSPSTIAPLPNFSRVRSNSAADLLSMRRPATSQTSMGNPDVVYPSATAFSRHPALMKSASASVLGLHKQPNRPETPDSMTSTEEYGIQPHGDHENERDRWQMMRREHEERWMNANDGISPSHPSPEAERVGNALNSLSPSSHLDPLLTKSQSPPHPPRPRLKSMTSLVALPSASAAGSNNTVRSKSGFRGLVERMRGNSSAGTTPASSYPSTPNANGDGTSPQPPAVEDYDLFAPGPDPFAREVPTPTHSPSASLSLGSGNTPTAANPGIGGILGRKQPKRKLVITGVGIDDLEAYEAVKSWCESFGELREVTRASNGAMYVDFRKASVADTVCRVQAQVFIKGAGSVALSWYTKKRPT
ncbi:hypothetical protein CPB83DRAFT_560422 [Crepidotus variabilis]|uniref:Uncharacterized protein n=1 Tax=Crepidotus variabilis TaxID=179855 RepID=A0A9P6EA28_9AGAR|nr:hypothetical protein CPB83DRAFT_560422 [Crepidotus variabilis]